jgi:hypothetical protein
MICKICGKEKDSSEFYSTNKVVCKECVKERVYNQKVERLKRLAEENGISYNPRGHYVRSSDPSLKWCNECHRFLPLSEFGWSYSKKRRRINSVCKPCAVKRVQRCPNREITILRSNINKKIRKTHNPDYAEHLKRIDVKYQQSERGKIMSLLNNARKRASMYNIEFNLTPEDIYIPDRCPILGKPFIVGVLGGSDYSISLDRIDPDKGYVKGNVQVISKLANSMKQNASVEDLKSFANYILNNY